MKNLVIFIIALIALAFFATALDAQTPVISPATISGDGAAHAVTTTAQRARWIIFIAPASNTATNCSASAGGSQSACPRVGDSNVTTSRGVPLPPGSSLMYPYIGTPGANAPGYGLNSIFYVVQSGDTLIIQYAQ